MGFGTGRASVAEPPTARRTSPRGASALSAWCLPTTCGLTLQARNGRRLAWPACDDVIVARLFDGDECLDEGVVVGRADGAADVFLHGGDGVARALGAALARRGVMALDTSPASGPRCWRAAVAWASARSGALAQLMERLDGAAAGTPSTQADARRACALLPFGACLDEPPVVRLVGRPNAGKSTLFNALLGRRRALVSPVAGTTRDAVRAPWLVRGVPVQLEDTAGVEALGDVDAVGAAALVLLVTTASPPSVEAAPGALVVRSHADQRRAATYGALDVSGLTGAGVAALEAAVADRLAIPASTADDCWAPVWAEHRAQLVTWAAAEA